MTFRKTEIVVSNPWLTMDVLSTKLYADGVHLRELVFFGSTGGNESGCSGSMAAAA